MYTYLQKDLTVNSFIGILFLLSRSHLFFFKLFFQHQLIISKISVYLGRS